MAIRQDITDDHGWFAGEDKKLEFEILADDGKLVTDPTKGVVDIASWTMVWALRKRPDPTALVVFPEKRTGGQGIAVIGVFNSSRAVNTQRVQITVNAADTDAVKAGTYFHALKRLAAGTDSVLVHGSAAIQRAAAPAA